MDRRWLPLNALRAFEAVGRHQSFTAAAQSLRVTQSAVSRHVITLEALLGVPLFERRPHQLTLTEAGAALLPVVTKAFDRIETALGDVVSDAGVRRRTLRVRMPPTFAHQFAVEIVREFRRDWPDLNLEVESPHGVGPAGRDADLSLVYSKPQVTDDVADLMWMVRLTVLCHPELLRRRPAESLAALIRDNELLHVRLENEPRYMLWQQFVQQSGLGEIDVGRGQVFDTAILAAQYAMSGEGVALLDQHLFQGEIEGARLIAPFDVALENGYGYFLHIHPEDLGDPAVMAFRSWLIRRFGGAAEPETAPLQRGRLRRVETG